MKPAVGQVWRYINKHDFNPEFVILSKRNEKDWNIKYISINSPAFLRNDLNPSFNNTQFEINGMFIFMRDNINLKSRFEMIIENQ